MFVIFLRAVILYALLLIVMRLMGKRQIGEMQPFEFIITLLIAELACIPMTDISIPLSYGIVSLLAVFILHQVMSLLERLGDKVKFLISGKPSVVITPDGVNGLELKKNNLGVSDLAEALRSLGYFSFDSVTYAIFESNGKLSALKNENITDKSLPIILINEGKIERTNFEKMQITFGELSKKLTPHLDNLKKITVLTMDEKGKIYLQKKGCKYQIFNIGANEKND